MSNKGLVFFLLFIGFSPFTLIGQDYLFPVKPGQRAYLSGNFSEIRPNHFHAGIDVKIGGVDGEPIYAISDGYIKRIKISSFGYGNVVYLQHSNGESSVYAHLSKLAPKIMDFMLKEMYFAKKNELEVFPDPEFLPIKRGELLGNGGNTGSSGGPHLHFEIRDSLERPMDPFKFGFKEVVDNSPPILYRIALVPIGIDSRVNGKFQRQEFNPVLEGGRYVIRAPIKVSGTVGLEIYAVDKMDGVSNVFGIPNYELRDEEKTLFKIHIPYLDYDLGRFALTHLHQNRFTRLYKYPNNPFSFYEPDSTYAGAISVSPEEKKGITVSMVDFFGNTRQVQLQLQGEPIPVFMGETSKALRQSSRFSYQREMLKIETGHSDWGNLAKVFVNGHAMEIPPAYVTDGIRTYLWDMNYGIPDSIDVCTEMIFPPIDTKIPFAEEIAFSNRDVEIKFEENTLLDDLYLRVQVRSNGNGKSLQINSPEEYLQFPMEVLFKNPKTGEKQKSTQVYLQNSNGRKSWVGGEWIGDDIRFKTRNFGTFVLDEDKVPPTIRALKIASDEIRFLINDDKSGIKDFEAYVDDQWVLMRYEHKKNVIWSEKLEKQPFKGAVLLKVRDQAGNETTYQGTIN